MKIGRELSASPALQHYFCTQKYNLSAQTNVLEVELVPIPTIICYLVVVADTIYFLLSYQYLGVVIDYYIINHIRLLIMIKPQSILIIR